MRAKKRWPNRIKTRGLLFILGIILVVILGSWYYFNATRVTPTTNTSKGIQVTDSSKGDYQSVVKDGHYLTSRSRGLTTSSLLNAFDAGNFEAELLELSKIKFKPSEYIFQEGQYLSSSELTEWLARKSKDDKEGLNPEDNGNGDNRNPIYVQAITEQDFMKKSGSDLALSGMTIGIVMNTQDEYTKEDYGPTFTQSISKEKMKAYGRKVAEEVLKRLREIKGVNQNTPIMIALYAGAPSDSLAPGDFYEYAFSSDKDKLSWKKLNWENIVLPKEANDDSSLGKDQDSSFINFQNEIQNFFPNIASTTAVAKFRDNSLHKLIVSVNTQFYSETEIRNFAQFVKQAALKYLPSNVETQIKIITANQLQAILNRSRDDESFKIIYTN